MQNVLSFETKAAFRNVIVKEMGVKRLAFVNLSLSINSEKLVESNH